MSAMSESDLSPFFEATSVDSITKLLATSWPQHDAAQLAAQCKTIAVRLYEMKKNDLADALISDLVDFTQHNTGPFFELEKLKFLNQPMPSDIEDANAQAHDMARRGIYDVIIANRFDQIYRPLIDSTDPVAFHRHIFSAISSSENFKEFSPEKSIKITASPPNTMSKPRQLAGPHFLVPDAYCPDSRWRLTMHLYRFKDVQLLKYGAGLAVHRQNTIFPAGMNVTGMFALHHVTQSNINLEHIDLDGPVIMPMDAFSCPNYGHWLLDYLYRILYLLEHFNLPANQVKILVRDDTRFYKETLARLGISPEQIIPIGRRATVSATELYACSTSFTDMHTHTQNMDPAILALLREKIGGDTMSKTPPHRKFYISRGDVGERNILGESALIEALKKRGYEIIQPGNFSFLDQIKIFSEAHTVIGPHSSGLCNLLFSQPSCKILEIMPSHFGTGVNADLACTLGMDYAFWAEDTGRTFKDFRYLTSYYARNDFSVDIDDILEKESSL